MTDNKVFDVIIIGGGIVGASAALKLRAFGQSVCLVESSATGSRSSGVNYGGVRRQGRSLVQIPLTQRAHAIWARLQQTIGIDGEYVRSGHLKLARSEADMAALQRYWNMTANAGLGLELLGRQAVHHRFPWLGEEVIGGSFCPEDGHANPRLVSPGFAMAAKRAGATILEYTTAQTFAHDGKHFQVTVSGHAQPLLARSLINAAGAWSNTICAAFGEPVPMSCSHPLMLVTEPIPVFMQVSLGVEGGGIYARQVSRGNCVLGGSQGYALDEFRARPGGDGIALITSRALALLPALKNVQVIRTWSGTEGRLPDREPVISLSSTTPGLVHGFGFAGAGFQIGPAVGEVLAELVVHGQSTTPIEAFSIKRFASSRSETQ